MIIELINNITEPLRLPEWTPTLVIVLLAIGFPVVIIFSWIYDVRPDGGMVKTEPAGKIYPDEPTGSSNGWKIASYISFVVIIGLIVLNISGGKRKTRIAESREKSIAVLPFMNLSGDQEQNYVCIGLTDEIINHLYKVRSFDEVRSMTTVSNYLETRPDIPVIAKELKVNYILEGSLKRIGDKFRVTAQLIDAANDTYIWLDDYDLPSSEIMGVPAEIALQIAKNLRAFITEDEQLRISKIPTSNEQSYRLLQESKVSFYNHWWPAKSAEIEMALQASRLDPTYAEAFAWAGYLIFSRGTVMGDMSIQTVAWDALNNFQIALDLDPDNATAHYGKAMIEEFQMYNYIAAEKAYLRAIELEPNNKELVVGPYQDFLIRRSLFEKALLLQSQLDSLNESTNWGRRIWIQSLSGNIAESMDIFETHIHPNDTIYGEIVGNSLIYNGDYVTAINGLKFYLYPRAQVHLAIAYYLTGSLDQAESIVIELKELSQNDLKGSPDFFLGSYYSSINQIDSAFVWLERAYENRSPEMSWLKALPLLENLKKEDRYWDLYARTGHQAYDDYLANKRE